MTLVRYAGLLGDYEAYVNGHSVSTLYNDPQLLIELLIKKQYMVPKEVIQSAIKKLYGENARTGSIFLN